jgi:hypothetical protein
VTKGLLIGRIFIDVRNSELGLPEKGVIGTLKNLPLLSDRMHYGFKGGSSISDPEAAGLDLRGNLLDTSPYRAEIL